MQVEPANVHQILAYRLDAEFAAWLPIGVLTLFCGLFLFALESPGLPPFGEALGAAAAVAVGIGITALALWRRFRRGKPYYVLSPTGIHMRIPFAKLIVIPWSEIQAVDGIDITVPLWSLQDWLSFRTTQYVTVRDLTVVVVSKQFYDRHIFIDSFLLRGPGWNANFIVQGPLVQCALQHEIVAAEPQALRQAVEARWLAFASPAGATRTSVPRVTGKAAPRSIARAMPKPDIVAAGSGPKPISWWDGLKIVVPLIGIVVVVANLAGLWKTEAQTKAHEKREKNREWAESLARNAAESKALQEKLKKQREELDDFWRRR
jgi:hypothetical protein